MQASLLSATFLSGSAAATTAEGLTGAGTATVNAEGQPGGLFDSLLPQQGAVAAAAAAAPAASKAQAPATQNTSISDDMAQAGQDSALLFAEPVDAAVIAPANTQVPTAPAQPTVNSQLQPPANPALSILDQAARAEAMLKAAGKTGGNLAAATTPSTPLPASSAPPAATMTAAMGQPANPVPGGVAPATQTSAVQTAPTASPVTAPGLGGDAAPATTVTSAPAPTLDASTLVQTARANGEVAQVETARADALAGRFNQRAEWLSSRMSAEGGNGAALAAALNANSQGATDPATTQNTLAPASPQSVATTSLPPGKQPTMAVMAGQPDNNIAQATEKASVSTPVSAPLATGIAGPASTSADLANPAGLTASTPVATPAPSQRGTPQTVSANLAAPARADVSTPVGTAPVAATPAATRSIDPLQNLDNAPADPALGKPQSSAAGIKSELKADAPALAAKGESVMPPPAQPRPAGQAIPGAALTPAPQMQAPQTQPGMSAEAATPVIAPVTPQQAGQAPASAPGEQLKQKISKTTASASGVTANPGSKPAAAATTPVTSSATTATGTAASNAATTSQPATPAPLPADKLPPPVLSLDSGSGLRAEPDLTLNRMDVRPTGLERSATPDGARFTPQTATNLAAQIQRRFVNGARVFDIRLDPAELGRVDVRLELSPDQRVQAILTIERPETLAEMQRNARELERALAEAGLDVGDDGLEFQLGGDTHWEDAEDQLDEDMIPVFQESEYLDLAEAAVEPQAEREAYGFRLAGGRDRLDMRI